MAFIMSPSAFYNPVQQMFTLSNSPKFGTHPDIAVTPNKRANKKPLFGTTISANPNFKGSLPQDTFERTSK
jgi:hypothetical protein